LCFNELRSVRKIVRNERDSLSRKLVFRENIKKFAVIKSVKSFTEISKSEDSNFSVFHGFVAGISDFDESRRSVVSFSTAINRGRIDSIVFNVRDDLISHNFFKNFGKAR